MGGVIIIRQSSIRQSAQTTASDQAVYVAIPDARKSRLDPLLATHVDQWTNDDYHFVSRCLGEAHDTE